MFLLHESKRNFHRRNEKPEIEKDDGDEEKERKVLTKFIEANHPYSI